MAILITKIKKNVSIKWRYRFCSHKILKTVFFCQKWILSGMSYGFLSSSFDYEWNKICG